VLRLINVFKRVPSCTVRSCFLCFVDRACCYNCVKKTKLDTQLILSIFCQSLHVSGVSRLIIGRYSRMHTTIGTFIREKKGSYIKFAPQLPNFSHCCFVWRWGARLFRFYLWFLCVQNSRGHNTSTFCRAARSQTKTSRGANSASLQEHLGQRSSDLTAPFSACIIAISMFMALWPVPAQTPEV
jgi:hypothetical protein